MEHFKETDLNNSEIKILVVDDRDDNLFSIETILEQGHYNIVKATSGRAALKILLKEQDFSLILMDVQMPDMSGYETAALIYEREKLKDIPIIFITAHNYGEDHVFKGYRIGAVDYIYKPINPDLLRAKVDVFVELYRKNQTLISHERRLLAINNDLQKEINDRKVSEEKVRSLNEQLIENNIYLKAMNEDLDRYAYVASHDLQEPLRKIMIFSDKILSKKIEDDEINTYLTKIVNSSKRMQTLIEDVLRFSRHNTQPADFSRIDLNVLMRDVLHELDFEIEKTRPVININPLPEIWGIPVLIHQLFLNLLSNAIKFSNKREEPLIQVSSMMITPDSNGNFRNKVPTVRYHQISITDNGIGFDASYSDEIFRVFKRLHSYHEYTGTGIGLSICKKIVEQHDGFISAEGRLNEGATFTIELPEKKFN